MTDEWVIVCPGCGKPLEVEWDVTAGCMTCGMMVTIDFPMKQERRSSPKVGERGALNDSQL